jgi:hypothetical protein
MAGRANAVLATHLNKSAAGRGVSIMEMSLPVELKTGNQQRAPTEEPDSSTHAEIERERRFGGA